MFDEVLVAVGSVGFPIVVALYLLIRGESIARQFALALKDMDSTLKLLAEVIRKCPGGESKRSLVDD